MKWKQKNAENQLKSWLEFSLISISLYIPYVSSSYAISIVFYMTDLVQGILLISFIPVIS